MDKQFARLLLENVLERASSGTQIILTSMELEALRSILENPLQNPSEPPVTPPKPPVTPSEPPVTLPKPPVTPSEPPVTQSEPPRPKLRLNLAALNEKNKINDKTLMCLDFGTAFSKAAVMDNHYNVLDLPLGVMAGAKGYTLPSSIQIEKDGRMYLGFKALDISVSSGAKEISRIDSMKEYISQQNTEKLEENFVSHEQNPCDKYYKLTQKDILILYLAYLTDTAGRCLEEKGLSRYARRRFSHPCWNEDKYSWACENMKELLAQAQILADTLAGKWDDGIEIHEFKNLIEQLKGKSRNELPMHLIAEPVSEPVAVAAPVFDGQEYQRNVMMVIDVGAGTTDFGIFIYNSDEQGIPHVHIMQNSITCLPQAGDAVDRILKNYILKKENLDNTTTYGQIATSNLQKRLRETKELLFKNNVANYILTDDRDGTIELDEFLSDHYFNIFANAIKRKFNSIFENLHPEWIKWLAGSSNRVQVLLTGGSSDLPIFKELQSSVVCIEIEGVPRKIKCVPFDIDKTDFWQKNVPDVLHDVYPQLAVALGGISPDLPENQNWIPDGITLGKNNNWIA